MQSEFFIVRGKVILERDVLYIRNLKPALEQTVAGQVFFPAILILLILLKIIFANNPLDYITAGIFFIVFFTHFNRIWDIVFRKSFANRIPLERIVSFEAKSDDTGLETFMILRLKNGRYRSIVFRTRENQYQPFSDMLHSKKLMAAGV